MGSQVLSSPPDAPSGNRVKLLLFSFIKRRTFGSRGENLCDYFWFGRFFLVLVGFTPRYARFFFGVIAGRPEFCATSDTPFVFQRTLPAPKPPRWAAAQ